MTYAIIKVAGKQYRVREGERLLVDRLASDEGATLTPTGLVLRGARAPALHVAGGEVGEEAGEGGQACRGSHVETLESPGRLRGHDHRGDQGCCGWLGSERARRGVGIRAGTRQTKGRA